MVGLNRGNASDPSAPSGDVKQSDEGGRRPGVPARVHTVPVHRGHLV